MTAEAETPWEGMICAALGMGISPEAFWRLSVREWSMLTAPATGVAMGRELFDQLAAQWPDEERCNE